MNKVIHFPANSGLSPRPACQYDMDCLAYALAIRAENHGRKRELAAKIGGSPDDLDWAFSHGRNLLKCKVVGSN